MIAKVISTGKRLEQLVDHYGSKPDSKALQTIDADLFKKLDSDGKGEHALLIIEKAAEMLGLAMFVSPGGQILRHLQSEEVYEWAHLELGRKYITGLNGQVENLSDRLQYWNRNASTETTDRRKSDARALACREQIDGDVELDENTILSLQMEMLAEQESCKKAAVSEQKVKRISWRSINHSVTLRPRR
jgi:hypothetical protein